MLSWLKRRFLRPQMLPADVLMWPTPQDPLTLRQAYEGGIAILGSSGSGKSSGPGDHLARGCARLGAGMVILPAKKSDRAYWERLFEQEGRAGDLIRFGPGSGHQYDWLNYELSSPGGSVESAAQLMQTLVEVSSRSQGQGDEQFWMLASARHMRNALSVVWMAQRRCSVSDVYRFVTSAPSAPEDKETAEWQQGYCAQCLLQADMRSEGREIDMVADYWLAEWPRLSDKTKSVIYTMCVNVLARFMTGPVGESMSGGATTVSPDDALSGKCLLIDYPPLEHHEPGVLAEVIWKVQTQRAALRRVAGPDTVPVVLFTDESHLTALPAIDAKVMAVCRSHLLFHICIAQNLPLLYASLGGGEKAKQEAHAWLANMQTKILCSNSCNDTNTYFAQLIGMHKELLISGGGDNQPYSPIDDWLGTGPPSGSASFGEHYEFAVRPEAFGHLTKGGPWNDYTVEAYVFQGGRLFSNGKTWIKGAFRQRV